MTTGVPVPGENLVTLEATEPPYKWAFVFLWLFTVAIFGRPEDIFPAVGQVHLTLVFGCCAGLAYLGALLAGRASHVWSAELWIVLLLTAWYAAGIPFAFWRSGSMQVLLQVWLKTVVIFFLLMQTLVTLKRIQAVLWAVILSELAVTSFSVFESSKAAWVGQRMAGFSHGILGWNFLGIAAAITIPYICALFVMRRSLISSAFLSATSLSMLWMLVLTASRSGVLDVLFSLVLTAMFVTRGSARGRLIGGGIALALVIALSLAPMVFWQRLGTIWNSQETVTNEVTASAQESAEDHLEVLNRSIEYTLEHPVFGLGLGNFEVANGTDLGLPAGWIGTHNTFTEISSEAGIPALLLFCGALASSIRNMRRVSAIAAAGEETTEVRLLARATLVALLSFVFAGFFAHLAYEYYCFYPVAIAVGIQLIAGQAVSCERPGVGMGGTAWMVKR